MVLSALPVSDTLELFPSWQVVRCLCSAVNAPRISGKRLQGRFDEYEKIVRTIL